ncbi:hypothetical protein [Neisseria gonorrhoeae]|uniref:hypothetical protein n=1 Tax=Neisseria gonorrhoeae TaxID=485 RepID=UPI001F3ED9D2|nr:hypothetical protein [Neisseria gonorrhoeae]MCF3023184.1 hypothetical protein [Neisseria gonorrhoeae]
MPSEPSDGIFNRPPFTGAGQVRGNTRTVIPDNTAISKPVRQHRNLETRHSRAGGNPDPSARKLIG